MTAFMRVRDAGQKLTWLVGLEREQGAYAVANNMRRLSVGRVLSPTLAILVDRELERRNFVPEKYCEVIASFDGFQGRLINDKGEESETWSHFPIEQKDKLEKYVKVHSNEGKVAFAEYEEEIQPPCSYMISHHSNGTPIVFKDCHLSGRWIPHRTYMRDIKRLLIQEQTQGICLRI